MPFLENEIVVNWVAPIFTDLVSFVLPIIVVGIVRGFKKVKSVKEANEKIINAIRPFIIQQINIEIQTVEKIRTAILKEAQLKEKDVYSLEEIQNKLILDISETRYLKEQEKQNLIDFTYKVFSGNIKSKKSKDSKNENSKKIVNFLIELLAILVLSIIGVIIKNNDDNYLDNPFYIMSIVVIACIFAIEYLELLIGKSEHIFLTEGLIQQINKIIDKKNKNK